MTTMLNLFAQSRLAAAGPRSIALVLVVALVPGGTLIVPLVWWLLKRAGRAAG
jgi:hypothetical protein